MVSIKYPSSYPSAGDLTDVCNVLVMKVIQSFDESRRTPNDIDESSLIMRNEERILPNRGFKRFSTIILKRTDGTRCVDITAHQRILGIGFIIRLDCDMLGTVT